MKYLLLSIFLLSLSGCAFKEIKPTNYYALEVKKNLPVYPKSSLESITLSRPLLNAPYNSKSIFFTQKPYVFEQYAVNKWVELPQLMLENMFLESLQHSHLFENVLLENSKIATSKTLKSHLIQLLHSYTQKQSFALVSMKFTLVSDNKIHETFYIKKEILCKENSPYGFIKAANEAFEEINTELLARLELLVHKK